MNAIPVLCRACRKLGLRPEKVFHTGESATLADWTPYTDAKGRYHSHDPNVVTEHFECSNGHRWQTRRLPACPCPSCDYGGHIPEKENA